MGRMMLARLWPLLLIGILPVLAQQGGESGATFVRRNLGASGWDVSNQNGSVMVNDVSLPVMVLEALYDAGKLESGDPLFRCRPRITHVELSCCLKMRV